MFNGPALPHDGLGRLDYLVVAVYLLAMFAMALHFARRQTSTSEFFLASRGMPWFAVGLSIVASLLSTLSYLSSPGEMIQHGIGFFWSWIAIPFSMAVVLLLWIPFFMRLKMTSAYEYLELRFNYPARAVAAVLFILLRLGWMAVLVYASSLALAEMTRPDWSHLTESVREERAQMHLYLVIAVVGIFASIYTAVGGMRAVIWTDVVQFIVLFCGALTTIGYVVVTTGTGPMDWWFTAAERRAAHISPPVFSPDPTVRITMVTAIVAGFSWTVCTHMSDQVALQRYFTTKNLSAARRSYVVNTMADVSVGVLLALVGLALLSFYLKQPDYIDMDPMAPRFSDIVFPHFIANQLPPGVAGLILAALIAAAMSSIDSGVNSVATVITTDFFERLFPQGQRHMSALTLARLLTLVVGFGVTLLAYLVDRIARMTEINIMELMPKGFNMFLGPLAGLFFIGMFLPRCRSRSAIGAVLAGLACSFAWSYWPELMSLTRDWPLLESVWDSWANRYGPEAKPTFTLAVAFPAVSTVAFGLIFGLLEPGGDNPGADYTWYRVIRRAGSAGHS
jgi:SSS family solute:Na+ symporter